MSAADTRDSKIPASSLVGDLESLRSLLAEDPDLDPVPSSTDHARAVPAKPGDSPSSPPADDAGVPVLDEMVQGTLAIDEAPLAERDLTEAATSSSEDRSTLGEETIKALLGDEWRRSADRILSAARDTIENVAHKWSPQQTNELNQALKVRIDATLEAWLTERVQERLEDLRSTLLSAIETEIAHFTEQLTSRDSDGE